jgi:hypothetical protein
MRCARRWLTSGQIGLGLLALPLCQLAGRAPGIRAADGPEAAPVVPDYTPADVPPRLLTTPSQAALREAAVWWGLAVQRADDVRDAEQERLRAWDPAAPFDAKGRRRQLLAADPWGYGARARAAAVRSLLLARTPTERQRALAQAERLDQECPGPAGG